MGWGRPSKKKKNFKYFSKYIFEKPNLKINSSKKGNKYRNFHGI